MEVTEIDHSLADKDCLAHADEDPFGHLVDFDDQELEDMENFDMLRIFLNLFYFHRHRSI